MKRIKRQALSCMLCLCVLLCAIPLTGVLAADAVTGTVVGINAGSKLYVRKEPSTSATVLDKLDNGDVVTILDTTEANGRTWYKIITPNNITGYSSAEYIEINATYENDEEFEAYLTAQKFPEDYNVSLRKIYAKHPNWVFKAAHLSMTWDTAYAAETKALRNAITTPDAWKSMEYGAYNWTTGEYVPVDDGGWVTAAPAVVAYYMDPRNWLDSTYIFQFEDLQYSDRQTVDGIKAILPSALDKHAQDLLKAAKETKVSAYFLATRMRQEGSHVNGLGLGTVPGYEGYYNFFNYGAYAHSGNGAVTNGAIYAKNQGWNTPYKCLVGSAKKIGDGYINKEQNTLYYQKFDVTDGGNGFYSHQYMTNVQAPSSEGAIRAGSLTTAEKNGALTFIIPVYKNMPAKIADKPSTTGNNNNFLDSITVKGHSLTPSFDRYTMDYAVDVGDADTVEITAKLNASGAKLTGAGKITLHPGDNEIKLTVTATSGQTRTYTVTVTTTGGENPPDLVTPTITGTLYAVDETITRVEPGTAVDKFIENLAVKDGVGRVYTAGGKAKTQGTIATGDILRLYSGSILCKSHPVVIYGDVNGDGKVSPLDLTIIRKDILNMEKTKGYFSIAGDVNKDSKLSPLDLTITRKFILKITSSIQ